MALQPRAGKPTITNTTFSNQWPNVTRKLDQTPADADEHKGEDGKFDKYFSPEPGTGD